MRALRDEREEKEERRRERGIRRVMSLLFIASLFTSKLTMQSGRIN